MCKGHQKGVVLGRAEMPLWGRIVFRAAWLVDDAWGRLVLFLDDD